MKLDEELDRGLAQLRDAVSPRESIVATVMDRTATSSPPRAPSLLVTRNWLLPFRFPRFAISAAVVTILILVASFLLIDQRSSSVFANQALAAFQQAKTAGVTVKERTIVVLRDGSRHTSSTSDTFFVGRDSYRRDIHDDDKLRETQWYTRKGDGMLQTSVRFDTKTFTLQTHKGGFGDADPVERMSLLIKFINEADHRLEPITLKGRQCKGFEIRSSKYGNNPIDWVDRIWFDPETKLPVRIEQERPRTEKDLKAFITVQDEFDWHPDFPANTFIPKIPEGFTLGK